LPVYINQFKPTSVLLAFELPLIMNKPGGIKKLKFHILPPPTATNPNVEPYMELEFALTDSNNYQFKDVKVINFWSGKEMIDHTVSVKPEEGATKAINAIAVIEKQLKGLEKAKVTELWKNMFNVVVCEPEEQDLKCEESHPLDDPSIGSRKAAANAKELYTKFFGANFDASSRVSVKASPDSNNVAYPLELFFIAIMAISVLYLVSFFTPKNKYSELKVEFNTDFDSI